MTDLTLYNGIILSYDELEHAFHGMFEWCGHKIEIAFVTQPDDPNGILAMQYTFEKLYSDNPKLEVGDLMDALKLSILVFDCDDSFEFSYETFDPIPIRVTVSGTNDQGLQPIVFMLQKKEPKQR